MSVPATVDRLRVRPLVESRPPAVSWDAPTAASSVPPDQPTLDLSEPAVSQTGPDEVGGRVTVVRARWTVPPRAGLPDAGEWGGALVVAAVQALLGQRPVAQLNRWLSDEVLSGVVRRLRQHRATPPRRVVGVRLGSVRAQHPQPEVAEVAARIVVGGAPSAVAVRLEAMGDRWLCTALEVDPRVLR